MIGFTLRSQVRKILALKQIHPDECAKRARVSQSTMFRLMNGAMPRYDVALALSAVLETPLDELFVTTIKTRRSR